MRRPAFLAVAIALGTIVLAEGYAVFRFLRQASDAAQWMTVERTLAEETSGMARRALVKTSAPSRPALSDEGAEEFKEIPAAVSSRTQRTPAGALITISTH